MFNWFKILYNKKVNLRREIGCPKSFLDSSLKRGFTIIELIAAMGLIGILATLTISVLGGAREQAKYARWQAFVSVLKYAEGMVAHYDFEESSGRVLRNITSGYGVEEFYVPDSLHGTINGEGETTGVNNTCNLPTDGLWTISASCILDGKRTAPASVLVRGNGVKDGVVLTVYDNSVFEIDFNNYELQLENQGKVVINTTGELAQTGTYLGTVGMDWTSGRWEGTDKGALTFDGIDDFVNLNNSDSLNFGIGEFTLIAWFKTSGRAGTNMRILSKGAVGSSVGLGLTQMANDDGTYPRKTLITVSDGTDVVNVSSTKDTDDGFWHMAAAVKDNSSNLIKLYIDGAALDGIGEVNTASFINIGGIIGDNIDNIDVSTNFNIGRQGQGSPDEYFYGLMDQVVIYNRAITTAEIMEHYQMGQP